MQRGEIRVLSHRGQHRVVGDRRSPYGLAPVHEAMADRHDVTFRRGVEEGGDGLLRRLGIGAPLAVLGGQDPAVPDEMELKAR